MRKTKAVLLQHEEVYKIPERDAYRRYSLDTEGNVYIEEISGLTVHNERLNAHIMKETADEIDKLYTKP